MQVELVKEKYSSPVNTVEIGAAGSSVKIGGRASMPFLVDEGSSPNEPVVCFEVWDVDPIDWPEHLKSAYGPVLKDPVAWARKCVFEFASPVLCVRLLSVHQDWGGGTVDRAVSTLKAIADEVKVPLIVLGCGDDEKDSELIPAASQALKGRNCLFGCATQDNYKTITATCLADGHAIIADSPIDVNIAKQTNILISEMGFDAKRIVMHPTTASLGYGMEYVYSIMERALLAAFMGDKMLSMPFVLFVGSEVWKTKEAKEANTAQGVNWEIATAIAMLQSGGDLIVMQHPAAVRVVKQFIEQSRR